jgi:hypothetical protein
VASRIAAQLPVDATIGFAHDNTDLHRQRRRHGLSTSTAVAVELGKFARTPFGKSDLYVGQDKLLSLIGTASRQIVIRNRAG